MTALELKTAFKQRVKHWTEKLEVQVQWLGVRPMSNKWASCSTNGHLNFNSDLLGFDQDVWDYVIVHELLHFYVPNHGKLWKSLMRAHLGDYENVEEKLRKGTSKKNSKRARLEVSSRRLHKLTKVKP